MSDTPHAGFGARLRTGERLVGTFLKTPSPILCEVLGRSALDAVCIDAEHAPFDRLAIDSCVHALRAAGMPSLVRIPSASPEHVLNALDCGATGIVVPHVTRAEEARAVARAAHYGRGGRGYAGSTRAARYGGRSIADHMADSAQETVVIAQIEDVEALDALDAIAAVDGIDCLFVGRIDLTVALGAPSPAAPAVLDAVERICAAGRAAGRPVGMFTPDLSELPRWTAAGASLFLLGSEHGFMLSGAAALAERVRGA